jgi:predicted RND superfamily exporter protein
VLAVAATLGAFATRLGVDNSLEVWFVDNDPTLQAYESFLDEFGNDEVVVVAIHATTDALNTDRLQRLESLTRKLQDIPGIARVHSLTNVGLPATQFDGLASQLVGRDGKTLVALAWMDASRDIDRERPRILDAVRSVTRAELANGESAHYGGIGVLHDALNHATIGEGSRFIGLSYLVIAAALLLITRRWLWTLLALLVVTLADISLLGVMSLLHRPINMITVAPPPVVMILGVANVVHMTTDVDIALSRGCRSLSELTSTLAAVMTPCAFNALTTTLAFLSLTTASMAVTRDYGLFAALGVAFAFCYSVVGMAALLPHARTLRVPTTSRARLAGAVERTVGFSMKRRGLVMIATVLLAILSGLGATRIVVDTHSMAFLPEDDVAREDDRLIEQTVGPYLPMEMTLRTHGSDWKEHEFLDAVAAAQSAVEADPAIGRTMTVADVLRDLQMLITGDRVQRPWTPPTDEHIAEAVVLLDYSGNADVLAHLVADDGRTLRLSATTPQMSVQSFLEVAARTQRAAQEAAGQQADVSLSGYLPLYAKMIERVVEDQTKSFGLAFFLVFLVVALVLRSWRFAVAAIPPNLLPIGILLAVMGFGGIRLDIATVTVAAVVLGVIVDDTVHLLHRLRRELHDGNTIDVAMRRVARASGLAVVSTSLVFAAGFFVISLAASDAVGNSGLLMTVAVLAALATDLLLLPAFVSLLFAHKRGSTEEMST